MQSIDSFIGVTRTVFIVLDALFFGIFVYAFAKGIRFRPKLHPREQPKRRTFALRDEVLRERWDTVMRRATRSPDSLKLAVVEADKMVDDALRRLNIEGDTMADRLKQLHPDEITTLDRIWRSHRLRNMIVHTPGFEMAQSDGEKAIEDFEAFLREIRILQ